MNHYLMKPHMPSRVSHRAPRRSTLCRTALATGTLVLAGCATHPPAVSMHESICSRPVAVTENHAAPLTPNQRRSVLQHYVKSIRDEISKHWFRPAGAVSGAQCTVHIKQRRDGCILDTAVTGCDDRNHLKSSVEKAVHLSSPLPRAPHPALFDPEVVLLFRVP